MNRRRADHRGIDRAHIARDDRLQRRHDVARDQHRIDADLGPRAVRAAPLDMNVKERARRHHGAGADRELPDRQAGMIVHAEHGVAGKALRTARP